MWQRVERSPVARLATVDSANAPHLVPLVFACDGSTVYSAVDHKPKRSRALKRLANIAANPRVSMLVDEYDDDWSQLWWVRLDGSATIVETGPVWERAVELLAEKYPNYRGYPPDGAVIVIAVDRIVGWTASRAE